MKTYSVSWTVPIQAESLEEAVIIARGIQLDPDSIATYFHVEDQETQENKMIDVLAIEEEQP